MYSGIGAVPTESGVGVGETTGVEEVTPPIGPLYSGSSGNNNR